VRRRPLRRPATRTSRWPPGGRAPAGGRRGRRARLAVRCSRERRTLRRGPGSRRRPARPLPAVSPRERRASPRCAP